jgi:hypothetical protein
MNKFPINQRTSKLACRPKKSLPADDDDDEKITPSFARGYNFVDLGRLREGLAR